MFGCVVAWQHPVVGITPFILKAFLDTRKLLAQLKTIGFLSALSILAPKMRFARKNTQSPELTECVEQPIITAGGYHPYV